MRGIDTRRWFVRGPGGASPGRKKRFVAGRPIRSGWRPTALRYGLYAMAPTLIVTGTLFAVGSNHLVQSTGQVEDIAGRGSGHGRGLGQYGAFDYAKAGWTAEQIVAHYYPDSTLGTFTPGTILVRLQGRDDKPLDVYSDTGMVVAGRQVEAGQAAHLEPSPGGANVVVTDKCGGDVVWQAATDNPWIDPVDLGIDRPASEHLKLCDGDTSYRGALGVATEGNALRTVNSVEMEDYLRGVVPREMEAGWADKGGAEALRAQAIAARSYSAVEKRYDYAQTCDTTDCQVYGGSAGEDPRTDEAVASTSGVVLMKDGAILRAEYSASSDADGTAEDSLAKAPPIVPAAPVVPDTTLTPDETIVPPDVAVAPELPATPRVPVDPSIVVAPGSAIDAKYREVGGLTSTLGAPIGPELPLPKQTGKFRIFTNGAIIWTPDVGAKVVDLSFLREVGVE
ncbi:SpoIID/LytB domain-containing protein [Antrihabitans stalactiti]|nr:SpoIID/LytB domain-containing protein [Antrihabitans stalactiti]